MNMDLSTVTRLWSDKEKGKGGKTEAELQCLDQGWISNTHFETGSANMAWIP